MDNSIQQRISADTIPIENLDMFVRALTDWHGRQVEMLKHMQDIPEGTEVQFNAGQTDVLSGDLRKGFAMGIELALIELGELPFVTHTS
jgi:hypothetical protein